jgi:hypothetical protein
VIHGLDSSLRRFQLAPPHKPTPLFAATITRLPLPKAPSTYGGCDNANALLRACLIIILQAGILFLTVQSGSQGQLGLAGMRDVVTPTLLRALAQRTVVQGAAGALHTALLTDNVIDNRGLLNIHRMYIYKYIYIYI